MNLQHLTEVFALVTMVLVYGGFLLYLWHGPARR